MEAYVDDMIVKTKESMTHVDDLRVAFEVMRRYNLRLNPNKCAFGVKTGKFLGFVLPHCGIEVNPEKIQAIEDMHSPRTIKEVQCLTGRLVALSRFAALSKILVACRGSMLPLLHVSEGRKGFHMDRRM